ncbi:MAG: helix-turn-helix domain-containing protein [Actinomycetota bacterium]|nr:helix-turn-helix domain-containing protein [Actinomycetota bacterium]
MVLRARIVLAGAAGEKDLRIGQRLGVATNTVLKWRKRFFEEGIDGLADRKRPGRPRSFSPSGGDRGEGAGLPAACDERGSPVALELCGAGG